MVVEVVGAVMVVVDDPVGPVGELGSDVGTVVAGIVVAGIVVAGIVVGGTGVISDNVEQEIESLLASR